jgi:hypothetical protein
VSVFNSHGAQIDLIIDAFGYFTPFATTPTMVSATVTNAAITITYNEGVSCGTTTNGAFKYYNTGSSSGGTIAGGSCTTAGDVLTMTGPVGGFTLPQSTATIVYTAPASPTSANAVYASSNNSEYAATQTISVPASTTAPAMVSATATHSGVGTGYLTVTYNENVNCPSGTLAQLQADYTYNYTAGTASGGAVTACSGGGTNVLTLTIGASYINPDVLTPTTTLATIIYTAPPSQSPAALDSPAASVNATGSSPTIYAASQTLSGAMWTPPSMASAASVVGGATTIVVTYSEHVNCPTGPLAAQTLFVYSNGGTPAYPSTCVGTDSATMTLGAFMTTPTGVVPATLVASTAADTLGYTEPATASNTTVLAVNASGPTFPQYAATQTIGLGVTPFMVSAVVTTSTTMTITYNEAVTCGSAVITDGDFVYDDNTTHVGGTATSCGNFSADVLQLTATGGFNAPAATASITYTTGGAAPAGVVYAGTAAAPVRATSPQTLSGI